MVSYVQALRQYLFYIMQMLVMQSFDHKAHYNQLKSLVKIILFRMPLQHYLYLDQINMQFLIYIRMMIDLSVIYNIGKLLLLNL